MGFTMKTRRRFRCTAITFPVTVLLLLVTVQAQSREDEFTFSSPRAGTSYRIGDVLRIEFNTSDTTVRLAQDMIGFTINDGRSWLFLNIALNGRDTVSRLKHYDWTIPDSVTSSRASTLTESTMSNSCRICIAYYQTKGIRGISELFSIKDRASSRINKKQESFFVPQSYSTNATPMISLVRSGIPGTSACFSIDGRLQSIVNNGPGAMDGARKGAGIRIMRITR